MMGITGHRMCCKGAGEQLVTSPQNLVNVQFPQKTIVRSAQLIDNWGRPVYRKDIHV